MFSFNQWKSQSVYSRRLQLFLGLSCSTLVTGLLAIALKGAFILTFLINLAGIGSFLFAAWYPNRRVPRAHYLKRQPSAPVSFIDLSPSTVKPLHLKQLPEARTEDEIFVRNAVQALSGKQRTRKVAGLSLVPDQAELLRQASIQAKLRDRRRAVEDEP